MNLLSIEKLAKSYGEKVLFSNVSFGIDEGDRIGLLGVNGTGKSTFLKVLAGVEEADEGRIIKVNDVRIEYLPQNPDYNGELTVLEQVFRSNSPIMKTLREYQNVLELVEQSPADSTLQVKLLNLSEEIELQNGWQIESEVKTILHKLGIRDFNAKLAFLSGGQKKRVAIASALINPADVLILDEPTNHIDNETISWFEDYLNKKKCTFIMVTHDRYFLDRTVNRIIELDKGHFYSCSGNYSDYLQGKIEREEMTRAAEGKRQNILRKELAWIRRGARARSTKQKARINRFEELKSRQVEKINEKLDISSGKRRLGKKLIEIENISKTFGEKVLINNFSYNVLRDDRLGIIGPNGSGKSTLLNIINGNLAADKGEVIRGQTVHIGYFTQEDMDMDENLRVIDYLREVAEYLPAADGKLISAGDMLERFLFPSDLQYIPVGKLSGGEKRRLYLLRILMAAPNVLLLDEPSNDLDIETLTILEDYLDDFQGVIIAASHDRYFLDRITNKTVAFEEEGLIKEYAGNYSDYENKKNDQNKESAESKNYARNTEHKVRPKERTLKFTFKEQMEYEKIDDLIEEVEKQLKVIADDINKAGGNSGLLQELADKQLKKEEELQFLLERWTYLNELAEEIASSKKK